MNRPLLLSIGLVAFLSISTWTPVAIISTHPDNISYINSWPEMAVDAVGNTYVVWQGSDGNDREVYWVKVDASGEPGTVLKVSTHPDNVDTNDWLPQIAVDSSGNSYITWSGSDGNDKEIYWVKVDEGGTPGTIQKISTYPDGIEYNDSSPHIASDSEGNTFVTWGGSDGTNISIYWVKIDAEGVPCTVQKISNHPDNKTCCNYDPQIVIDTSGKSYVVWHGCDKEECWREPGDLEIYWVKIDSEGVPGTVQKIPPTSPDNVNTMAMQPQLAVDAQGTSYIVWSGIGEESYDIYWVRIDASGELGATQKIQGYPDSSYNDYNPRIAVKSGALYITWENFDKNDYDVYWVMIDTSGKQGVVQKISDYRNTSAYDDRLPRIAVDSSGNSLVTWEKFNRKPAEQFDQRIYWVKIDPEGKLGKIYDISPRQRKHFDKIPQIAVDAEGNSYVIWQGNVESGNDLIFYTARHSNPALSIALTMAIPLTAIIILIVIVITRKKSRREYITKTDP